jgi:hypothetical protein
MKTFRYIQAKHLIAAAGLALLAGAIQYGIGRIFWCECGQLRIWSGEIASSHNSQHLFDPYTFTHVLHGIGFYGLLWLALRRWAGQGTRFVIAIGMEAVWEVIENTKMVIERYRDTTISLGYYGDSIANSLTDIVACGAGYLLALWLPVWLSISILLAVEALLLWCIRDSLLLNILMLIRPIESIKDWQGG